MIAGSVAVPAANGSSSTNGAYGPQPNQSPTAGRAVGSLALNAWTNLEPVSSPLPRSGPAIAFDSRSGTAILIGGCCASPPLNDTWSYEAATNSWSNLHPSAHPELCPYFSWDYGTAAMVYDSRADRIILYGGCQGTARTTNTTWAYDAVANEWSELHPAASPWPGGGRDFGLVYDTAADKVILFGGGDRNPQFADGSNALWTFDYSSVTWTQLHPAVSPSPRFGMGLAYDSSADRVLLFGGCRNGMTCTPLNDTWSYDYWTNTWTNVSAAVAPPAGVDVPMVYDSKADRLVLFGQGPGLWGAGSPLGNATWTYDYSSNAWTNQSPIGPPPPRYAPGMIYDSVRGRTMLFGGIKPNGTLVNDSWSYSLVNAQNSSNSGGPLGTISGWLPFVVGGAGLAATVLVAVAILWGRRRPTRPPREEREKRPPG